MTATDPTATPTVRAAVRRRGGWRGVARAVGGFVLLAVGVALLVLPGPGLAVSAAGLGVLATEYAWARRALDAARARVRGASVAAATSVRPGGRPGRTRGD